jgi:hypothetical protein
MHRIAPTAPLDAADLDWTLEPLPRLEDVDVLTLTDLETTDYTASLRRENRILRELLHEALALLARLTQRLKYR